MKRLLSGIFVIVLAYGMASQAAQQETWSEYMQNKASSFWDAFTEELQSSIQDAVVQNAVQRNPSVIQPRPALSSQASAENKRVLEKLRWKAKSPNAPSLVLYGPSEATRSVSPSQEQQTPTGEPKRLLLSRQRELETGNCSESLLQGYRQQFIPYDDDPAKAAQMATDAFLKDLNFQGSFVEQQQHWQDIYKRWVVSLHNYIGIAKKEISSLHENPNAKDLAKDVEEYHIKKLEAEIQQICVLLTQPQPVMVSISAVSIPQPQQAMISLGGVITSILQEVETSLLFIEELPQRIARRQMFRQIWQTKQPSARVQQEPEARSE